MSENTEKKPSWWHRHWHGIVQGTAIAVFIAVCCWLVHAVKTISFFEPYDALLFVLTGFAFVVAVVQSHAYNYTPNEYDETNLRERIGKLRAIWLHSNITWQTIYIWMMSVPFYCTCIAIYLSGNNGDYDHILIYSILSLVITLGCYAIQPLKRANQFRKAYAIASAAIVTYDIEKTDSKILADAIIEAEQMIADQDISL